VKADVPEEDVVIGGGTSTKSKSEAEKDTVSPHSIDGFWVQRQISEVYPDPVTAVDKAASVIDILGSDSGARDRESAHGAFHYDSSLGRLCFGARNSCAAMQMEE
jgi:pre-mRNA-splicing helicase BRR2